MNPNPYQSPMPSQGKKLTWRGAFGPIELIALCACAVTVLGAGGHRLLLSDPDAYRSSPLIALEIVGVLILLAIIPFAFFRAVILFCKGRPAGAAVNVLACVLAIVAIAASFWIDAPTLLYAT